METTISKSRLWTARIMSGIVTLFMLFDSISKFFQPVEVVEGTVELGYEVHHIAILGILGFLSIVIYAIPRTSVFGSCRVDRIFWWSYRYPFAPGQSVVFSYSFSGLPDNSRLGRDLAKECKPSRIDTGEEKENEIESWDRLLAIFCS